MDFNDFEQVVFTVISNAGEANGFLQQAFLAVKDENYQLAEELLKKSDESLNVAHGVQTKLIQNEINGIPVQISLLMVHAQDHLMNVILCKQIINNQIVIQKEINELRRKVND